MVTKDAFEISVLPTTNGKSAMIFGISSSDEFVTYYQELVEKNLVKEKLDYIRRHYQMSLSEMIRERPSYAISVKRAMETLGENSIAFRTQYKCEFPSKTKTGFFDIRSLNDMGIFRLDYNEQKYLKNPNYIIVAGVDFAISGNNSVITIKALESGFGIARKTYILYQEVLNKTKNIATDNLRSQFFQIARLIKDYNVKAILMDGTGIGKSSSTYLKEIIAEKYDYLEMDFNNIQEINLGTQNRLEILTNYYNRINSGMEILWKLPYGIIDETTMKKYYNQWRDVFDNESEVIRFLYEHMRFKQQEEVSAKGISQQVFKQSPEYKLEDDTLFSSALCSFLPNILPYLTQVEENIDSNLYTKGGNVGRYRA